MSNRCVCIVYVLYTYRPCLIGVYALYRPCLIGVYVLYRRDVHEWEGGRCEFHPLWVCTHKKCDDSEEIKCMETVQPRDAWEGGGIKCRQS